MKKLVVATVLAGALTFGACGSNEQPVKQAKATATPTPTVDPAEQERKRKIIKRVLLYGQMAKAYKGASTISSNAGGMIDKCIFQLPKIEAKFTFIDGLIDELSATGETTSKVMRERRDLSDLQGQAAGMRAGCEALGY